VAVELSPAARLFHAPLALLGQLRHALLPDGLSFSNAHPALGPDAPGVASAGAAWALVLVLAAVLVREVRRRPGSRSAPLVQLGLGWFVLAGLTGALLPYGDALGPDRDAYLATPGFFLALGAAVLATLEVAVGSLFVFLPLAVASRLQLGVWRDTEHLTRHALAQDPEDPVARRVRGHDLLRRGKLTAATEAFEAVLARRPDDAGALLGLGIVAIRRPLLDRAEEAYLRALEVHPDQGELHARLGEVLQRRGDQASLVRAQEHFAAATRHAPTHLRAWTRRAVVEATLGRPDEARASAAAALALEPAAREAWLARGMAAEQEGDPDGAIEHYRGALAIERDYAEPLTNIGRLLLDRGDVEGALVTLERAYFLHPLYYDALYQCARAHELLGRTDEARLFYERTLAQSTRHMRARVALGFLDLAQGALKDAEAHAATALRRNASHVGARELTARIALARGDWTRAAGNLRSLLDQGAARPDLAALLVRVLAAAPDDDLRNGAEALRLARYWAQLTRREDPEVLAALAAAQAESGDHAAAEETLRKAAALLPAGRRGAFDAEAALYAEGRPLRLAAPGEAR
jgi:tetratricopeptide (TPR) repeat protein